MFAYYDFVKFRTINVYAYQFNHFMYNIYIYVYVYVYVYVYALLLFVNYIQRYTYLYNITSFSTIDNSTVALNINITYLIRRLTRSISTTNLSGSDVYIYI